MAISVDSCVVALLGRATGARAQLRQALKDLGAQVAFEGELASASQQVLDVAPNVVIVNLEEGADEGLEHLQAVFDSNTINVVFNDAEVSARLEGWDLARWARHLAAKVLGHDDTLPPLPAGAVLLPDYQAPARAHMPSEAPAWEAVSAHPSATPDPQGLESASFDAVASESPGAAAHSFGAPGYETAEAADTFETAEDTDLRAGDEVGVESGGGAGARFDWEMDDFSAPAQHESFLPEAGQAGQFDESEEAETWNPDAYRAAAEDDQGTPYDQYAPTDESQETEEAQAAQDVFDMEAFDGAGLAMSEDEGEHEGEDEKDEIEFDWQMDADALAQIPSGGDLAAAPADPSHLEAAAPDALAMDQDIAALLAQFDANEEPSSEAAADVDVAQGLDFSNFERPTEKPASAAPAPRQFERSADELDRLMNAASGLSLTAMEEEGEGEAAAPASAAAKSPGSSFDFSIVGDLSLEPMADPDSEPASGPADFGASIPAPPSDDPGAAQEDPLLAAMGLTDATDESGLSLIPTAGSGGTEIPRVVVLAASIGGPDALRTFLSGLSPDVQAAFLIVQHLESGYFDRLAQQLQKSTALPVKVATRGMRTQVGEVVVVPASERVTLEADGQLVFSAHDSPPQYSPSIDGVLRDVADRFGRRATAIIFSGLAGDGLEGAAYLTSRGGEVWVQDPSSCVVSSMVDGAVARGIVEFTGSPRELANRCTAMLAG